MAQAGAGGPTQEAGPKKLAPHPRGFRESLKLAPTGEEGESSGRERALTEHSEPLSSGSGTLDCEGGTTPIPYL